MMVRYGLFRRQSLLMRAPVFLLALVLVACVSQATERDNVERVVAVGDLHGDYNQFVAVLEEANIIDSRQRWKGGETHLVQIGDAPDRGPDTDKIIALLKALERQAKKAGGEVHALIGNHEAMNMSGDLRYVHPGEYAAFVDRRSRKRQTDYYRRSVEFIKNNQPEEQWPAFDKAHREAFNKKYPLGYVEHRSAWSPGGEIGQWVLEHDAVVRVNDSLFVHGGIAPDQPLLPVEQINQQVREALQNAATSNSETIIDSPQGPLWYRGLAVMDETAENEALLDKMLAFYGVKRIVIAHTPVVRTILPRFSGKVILADVGLAAYYGGARASLVIDDTGPYALLAGERVDLPAKDQGVDALVAYLRAAAAQMPDPSGTLQYIDRLLNPDNGQ
ncbi:MAG: metallophosphoesterase [Lysobacterales bacterium]